MYPLYALTALAAALVPQAAAVGLTDTYTDADVGQSGYSSNHNMDPAIVDSSEFGQLWKQTFNAQEQVSDTDPSYFYNSTVSRLDGLLTGDSKPSL